MVWRLVSIGWSIAFAVLGWGAAPPALAAGDGLMVVIIGNRNYTAPIPLVDYAHNDAVSMKRFFVEGLGLPKANVIFLKDATLGGMLALFGGPFAPGGDLSSRVKPGKTDVVVYFSGHGFPKARSKDDVLLLPRDAHPYNPEVNSYPLSALEGSLGALGARSVTLLVDACFSGNSAGGSVTPTSGPGIEVELSDPARNVTRLTATRGRQLAYWDKASRHGFFTEYLLRGLYKGRADANRDGRLTLAEMKRFLDDGMTPSAPGPQNADLKGDGSRILVRYPGGRYPKRPEERFDPESPIPSIVRLPEPGETKVETVGPSGPPAGPQTAFLFLDSSPRSAEVFIAGQSRSVGTTPINGKRLDAGQKRITLRKREYHDLTISATLEPGKNDLGIRELRPAFGYLSITSDPSGAGVVLNGTRVGVTPYRVKRMPSGRYELSLRPSEYHPVLKLPLHRAPGRRTVVVNDGQTTEGHVELESAFGTLRVEAGPRGAEVIVGGKRVGGTPYHDKRFPAGSYVLRLRAPEHLPGRKVQFTVRAGRTTTLRPPLPRPAYGTLSIVSEPPGAAVTVKDKRGRRFEPRTAPSGGLMLDPGAYRLDLASKGYETRALRITIVRGRRLEVRPPEARLRRLQGTVIVTSDPYVEGAEVYVDGGQAGRVPAELTLDAGRHEIEVRTTSKAGRKTVAVRDRTMDAVTLALAPLVTARMIREAQRLLPSLGYDPGPADGRMRRRTREAIRRFQLAAGLLADGKLTKNLLTRLREAKPRVWTDPGTEVKFIWVPKGCFQMGSNSGNSDKRPVHDVCIAGFWLGKYEVTQGEWQRVMDNIPSFFKKGDQYPVEGVSWNDVQDFLRNLNSRASGSYRLPTEAEWEYACRSGGKSQNYCGGSALDQVAWHGNNSGGTTHPVGTKAANYLGIHDMTGNVLEWVSDWYANDYYTGSPRDNPKGPSSGASRVLRGGGWHNDPTFLASGYRDRNSPNFQNDALGFRLAR